MNAKPRLPTRLAPPLPPEFEEILHFHRDSLARPFIFTAISDFLHRHNRGYFTIVGAPGSGKTAILAKYIAENPATIYYSAAVEGKNQPGQFLATVCTQLTEKLATETPINSEEITALAANPTEGSWLLSRLLQKISDTLTPNEKLIIAIDAIDAIAPHSQFRGANLFYLPRYLPNGVYFLLARRPFVREKSGLLIETPSQILDLAQYPEQNRADVLSYIHQSLSKLGETALEFNLTSWLNAANVTEPEFSAVLGELSENNFMYLSQIFSAIAVGFYPKPLPLETLPPGLAPYYETHWQRMISPGGNGIETPVLSALISLTASGDAVSVAAISQACDEDEFEIEVLLENWREFLISEPIDGEIGYKLYHSSFRQFLQGKLLAM